jgi:hypothetical protein
MDILATILHREAGHGDAIGGGRWLGGRNRPIFLSSYPPRRHFGARTLIQRFRKAFLRKRFSLTFAIIIRILRPMFPAADHDVALGNPCHRNKRGDVQRSV